MKTNLIVNAHSTEYIWQTFYMFNGMVQWWFGFWTSCANVFDDQPVWNNKHQQTTRWFLFLFQWRHNGHDSVSNHQPHDCFLSHLFRHRSKKTSKLRLTGLCAGNSPEAGEFPAQMASNAENVSNWWRHQVVGFCLFRLIELYGVWWRQQITKTLGLTPIRHWSMSDRRRSQGLCY